MPAHYRSRIAVPSLVAGPLVICFYFLQWWVSNMPDPVELHDSMMSIFPFMMMVALLGLPVALPANWLGSQIMIAIGTLLPFTRFPVVWALVGGGSTWAVLRLLDLSSGDSFPFVATGAVCAFLCRARLEPA